jgi:hypothetical protein
MTSAINYYFFYEQTIYKVFKETPKAKKIWASEIEVKEEVKINENKTIILYNPNNFKKVVKIYN